MKSPADEPWWGGHTPPQHWLERFADGSLEAFELTGDGDDEVPPVESIPVESGHPARSSDAPDAPSVSSAEPDPGRSAAIDVNVAADGISSGYPVALPSPGVESRGSVDVAVWPLPPNRRAIRHAPLHIHEPRRVRPDSVEPGTGRDIRAAAPKIGRDLEPVTGSPAAAAGSGVAALAPPSGSARAVVPQTTPPVHRSDVESMTIGSGSATSVEPIEAAPARGAGAGWERGVWPELPPFHIEAATTMWTPDQIHRLLAEHRS